MGGGVLKVLKVRGKELMMRTIDRSLMGDLLRGAMLYDLRAYGMTVDRS